MMTELRCVDATSLSQAFAHVRARTHADKVMLVSIEPSGQQATLRYGALWSRIDRTARLFHDRGLSAGAHVVISSTDDAALISAVLSCMSAGLTAVVVPADATGEESASMISQLSAPFFLIDEALAVRWKIPRADALFMRRTRERSIVTQLLRAVRGDTARENEATASYFDALKPLEPLHAPRTPKRTATASTPTCCLRRAQRQDPKESAFRAGRFSRMQPRWLANGATTPRVASTTISRCITPMGSCKARSWPTSAVPLACDPALSPWSASAPSLTPFTGNARRIWWLCRRCSRCSCARPATSQPWAPTS